MTTKTKRLSVLFTIVSVLLNICPIAVYSITALINADLMHEKVALSLTVFIVLILSAVCLVNKVALRSRLWILLIGLYFCLDFILTPLIVIAVCQVLDELIVSPVAKHYRNRYKINKEIDQRL